MIKAFQIIFQPQMEQKTKAFKFQKAASNHIWLNVTNCVTMGAENVRF